VAKDSLDARKKSILYIRGIMTLCLLLLAVYNYANIIASQRHVFLYIAVLIASNFVFMRIPKEQYEGLRLHYIIFITDIILLSFGTYWMANLDFQFFITMFLTIFMCAIARSTVMSLVIALVVNMIYLYMKTTLLGDVNLLMQDKVLLNIPFLFIVALHSSFLAENASEEEKEKKNLLKSKKQLTDQVKSMGGEMEQMTFFTSRVYESFREGVIVLDSYGIVKVFNSRCETIFNVRKGRVMNIPYKEVAVFGALIEIITDLKNRKVPAIDKETAVTVDGEEKKLIVNTALIKGGEDMPAGLLCTIRHINYSMRKEVI
jgi:PAS domain-containing protein